MRGRALIPPMHHRPPRSSAADPATSPGSRRSARSRWPRLIGSWSNGDRGADSANRAGRRGTAAPDGWVPQRPRLPESQETRPSPRAHAAGSASRTPSELSETYRLIRPRVPRSTGRVSSRLEGANAQHDTRPYLDTRPLFPVSLRPHTRRHPPCDSLVAALRRSRPPTLHDHWRTRVLATVSLVRHRRAGLGPRLPNLRRAARPGRFGG